MTRDQRGWSGLSGDPSNAVPSPLIGHLEKYLIHPRNWTEKKRQQCVHESKSGEKYFNSNKKVNMLFFNIQIFVKLYIN